MQLHITAHAPTLLIFVAACGSRSDLVTDAGRSWESFAAVTHIFYGDQGNEYSCGRRAARAGGGWRHRQDGAARRGRCSGWPRAEEATQSLPTPAHQEHMQGVRGGGHLPAPAPEEQVQGVRGGGHLPAPARAEQVQGVRGSGHLPAPAHQEHMQGVRRGGPLPAPAREEQVQGVRGSGHLPAPAPEEQMQGVRGGGPLPAPAPEE